MNSPSAYVFEKWEFWLREDAFEPQQLCGWAADDLAGYDSVNQIPMHLQPGDQVTLLTSNGNVSATYYGKVGWDLTNSALWCTVVEGNDNFDVLDFYLSSFPDVQSFGNVVWSTNFPT